MNIKKPTEDDLTLLEDYGLVDICNSHAFLLIDTSAATDVDWISLPPSRRAFNRKFNVKYSAPLEQMIEYNALIGALFAGKKLHTTEQVLSEIERYAKHELGGLQKSKQQIITSVERNNKIVSLEQTPEFEMYSRDRYFQRLVKMHGLSKIDIDLLLHFFTSLHNDSLRGENGSCALITNDRGILDTYKAFGYRLPKGHRAYSALFGQKYEPSFARE